MPFQAWPLEENGVKPSNDDMRSRTSDGAGGGFCTHSSILFLTWHRPYIALFEVPDASLNN